MKLLCLSLALALTTTACSGGSSATSCDEYALEVRTLIDDGAAGDELESFLENSDEHVAKLISRDPDHAGPCVEAVLEATFSVGFAELESFLDD